MPSIAEVYVTCLAETSKIAPELRKAFRDVDPIAREAGQRWGREIQQGLGDAKIELKADTAKAKAEIDEAARDRHSTIEVDVDKDRLTEVGTSVVSTLVPRFADAGQQAGDTFMSSMQGALKTPGIGLAVAGVLGTALVDIGGVAASASQSFIALPGLIGAAGVAMGTLKLATMGFSDALGDIKDPDKFATDLQGLSPAAQQAALAIRGLTPAFDALKNATQDALFAGVGGMLNNLANQYLPTIQQATTGIASAFNTMLSGVANQLMTPQTQQAIQGFLANVTQAFQNLAPAAAPFTKALADIAAAGSSVLPGIAQAVTQAAWAFSDFITKAKDSGQLQKWLGEGLGTLKQLGQIAFDVGRAFFAMAPAGQQILPVVVRFMDGLANLMPRIVGGVQAVQGSFDTWAPLLQPALGAVKLFAGSLDSIKGIASAVGSAVQSAMNVVFRAIDTALGPVREAINLANMVPGINIPQIPSIGPVGGAPVITPTAPAPVLAPHQFRRRDGSVGNGAPPAPALPTAALPPIPDGGYSVPLPPPPKAPKGAGGTPNLPYTGTADPYGGYVAPAAAAAGYTSDAALLAAVPAGKYDNGPGDLTKGLADCSSAVEDLVNLMDGNSTAGRSMSTYNEASWLTSHGFQPGMGGPGDFRVGFNDHHTQAILPGGTPFNWGSNAAAARGGVGGTGADDAAFTQHFYRSVSSSMMPATAGMDPMAAMGPGFTSQDLSLRNAQQRINDTQHTEEQAQGRLNELRAKGTATNRQLEAAEYALAKAKREHQDALDSLTVAQDKYNKASQKGQAGDTSGGSQLGQDFAGGLAEIFGFDGSFVKNPLDSGLFKGFKGLMSFLTQPVGESSDAGNGPAGAATGGGGGGLGSLLSFIPQAFTPGVPGAGGSNPTMPSMPDGSGINIPALATSGAKGAPGPGNVTNDYSIHVDGVQNPQPAFDAANAANIPRMRQGYRPLPS